MAFNALGLRIYLLGFLSAIFRYLFSEKCGGWIYVSLLFPNRYFRIYFQIKQLNNCQLRTSHLRIPYLSLSLDQNAKTYCSV